MLLLIFYKGINQAYGVFQSFYTNPPHPSISIIPPHEASNKALVAFVGTLGAGLTWGGSIFVNPLMARTSDLQRITMLGALGMGVGYWAASFGTRVSLFFPLTRSCSKDGRRIRLGLKD